MITTNIERLQSLQIQADGLHPQITVYYLELGLSR